MSRLWHKGGNNDYPMPNDFKNRIHMLMAEHIIISCNTNCEPDEDDSLIPLEILLNSEMQNSEALPNIVNHADIVNDTVSNSNVSDCNVIKSNIVISNNAIGNGCIVGNIGNIINNSIVYEDSEEGVDVFLDDADIFDDDAHKTNAAAYVGGYIAHVALKKFQCQECQGCLVSKAKGLSSDQLFFYI